MEARQSSNQSSEKVSSVIQVTVEYLIAGKDVRELLFPVNNRNRSHSFTSLYFVTNTGETVEEYVVLLLFCNGVAEDFCLLESALLMGDFVESFV